MGLNLSNQQIAKEVSLNDDDVHAMASHLRDGLVAKVPEATLDGEVEADEVYIVAEHKGNPAAVQKNKNGKTGCLLRLSGGVEREAGDVTVLVPSEAGGRANPGSGPCHLSGVRTGDADPLQQPSGHCVAAGSGSGAPEDPAL